MNSILANMWCWLFKISCWVCKVLHCGFKFHFLVTNEVERGLPHSSVVKNPPECRRCRRHKFSPWVGKILWRRVWQPTPVFLPGKSHEQRNLAGCDPWDHKELDTTKVTEHARIHWGWIWIYFNVCFLNYYCEKCDTVPQLWLWICVFISENLEFTNCEAILLGAFKCTFLSLPDSWFFSLYKVSFLSILICIPWNLLCVPS